MACGMSFKPFSATGGLYQILPGFSHLDSLSIGSKVHVPKCFLDGGEERQNGKEIWQVLTILSNS